MDVRVQLLGRSLAPRVSACGERDRSAHRAEGRLCSSGDSPLGRAWERAGFGVYGSLPAKGCLLWACLQILGWAGAGGCTREGTRVPVRAQELDVPAHVLKKQLKGWCAQPSLKTRCSALPSRSLQDLCSLDYSQYNFERLNEIIKASVQIRTHSTFPFNFACDMHQINAIEGTKKPKITCVNMFYLCRMGSF